MKLKSAGRTCLSPVRINFPASFFIPEDFLIPSQTFITGLNDTSVMQKNVFQGMRCLKCGRFHESIILRECPRCGGLLTGSYDVDSVKLDLKRRESIWQFAQLFPPVSAKNITTLGEGWTPFVKADSYGKLIGARDLWCKLEGSNPSGSFKDRAVSLEVSLVREWGKDGIFVPSSGNAAASVSTYAARAGMRALILIREDSTISKLGQISMYNPTIIRVRNLYSTKDNLFRALNRVQEALPAWHNGFIWVPLNPLTVDSLKTIAYEIGAVKVPDCVFVPTAGGDLLYGIYKGFAELYQLGFIERIPRMVAVQGENASPLVQAIDQGLDEVKEIESAETVAGALRVNFGSMHPLLAVKESKGFGVSVTDDEIMAAQRDIARTEGIFAEISSCAALAAVRKAISEGKVSSDEKLAVILTGSGFKDYWPLFRTAEEIPLMGSIEELSEKIGGLA